LRGAAVSPLRLQRSRLDFGHFPAATPPAVRKGSAFPGIATPPLSSGYAARRAERLRLSGNCHSSSFQRLRRPPCGKALPFRGLPLLLFLAATPPTGSSGAECL